MRRFLILALALLAGVATLVLMQTGMRGTAPAQEEQVRSETALVLVYARDLVRGTLIDQGSLRWQEQLLTAVPSYGIVSLDPDARTPRDLEGKLLRSSVSAGDVVRVETLADGAAGFMALTLAPGMRAVGITVTNQKLAGGFILPEDRVDLIHTTTGDFDGDGVSNSFSQTILENIRVLAVGETPTGRVTYRTAEQQDATADVQSDIRVVGDTVTLEMSDEQAHILFSAQASGQVSLALRALEDQGPARIVSRIGMEGMPPVPDSEPPEAEMPAAPAVLLSPPEPEPVADPEPPRTLPVRIIQGNQTNIIDVPIAPAPVAGTVP